MNQLNVTSEVERVLTAVDAPTRAKAQIKFDLMSVIEVNTQPIRGCLFVVVRQFELFHQLNLFERFHRDCPPQQDAPLESKACRFWRWLHQRGFITAAPMTRVQLNGGGQAEVEEKHLLPGREARSICSWQWHVEQVVFNGKKGCV